MNQPHSHEEALALVADFQNASPNLFDFSLQGEKNLIYLSKYHHPKGVTRLRIPDFVYGFLFQEEEPIFSNCASLQEIQLGKGIRTLDHMFYKSNIPNLSLSHWDISKVHSLRGMFHSSLLQTVGDLSQWDTGNILDLTAMFQKSQMTSVGELGNWNLSSLKLMSYFAQGSQLESLGDLSSWRLPQVKQIQGAFAQSKLSTSHDLLQALPFWTLDREKLNGKPEIDQLPQILGLG